LKTPYEYATIKEGGTVVKKKDQEKMDHQTNKYYAVLKKADTALTMAEAEIIRLKKENKHLKAENKLLKNKLKENFGIVLPDPPEKIQ
jgi:predicted RNase H-like nuclease (RuvC/YqgF family)